MHWAHGAAVVMVGCVVGCAAPPGPVPVGPGAATRVNLARWMKEGEPVRYSGWLQEIDVQTPTGVYTTWSLHPAGPYFGCEVDIRPCAREADICRDHRVTVEGTLIERGPRHLPVLVARRIRPERPPLDRGETVRLSLSGN